MKRAALIAGVSAATLLCAGPASAWSDHSWWGAYRPASSFETPSQQFFRPYSRPSEQNSDAGERRVRERRTGERKTIERSSSRTSDSTPPAPKGLLQIIVSIDKQRATLFSDGTAFASTAISSGTPGHPTPMGVFSVIQKDRHHVSNLYDAPMPYMQRITWSGSALHEGPLPGYPASHGCVRLTNNFAQLLWKATKLGVRVIVTRPEVAPLEFEHARLFAPRPKPVAGPVTTSTVVKTADASNATGMASAGRATTPVEAQPETAMPAAEQHTKLSVTDGDKPAEASVRIAEKTIVEKTPSSIVVDERPATMPAAIVREANRQPISVFVSLKEKKLYVRQGWKPLFDTPVSFEHPEHPIGTHVYTAMGAKTDGSGLRWTVISIPSGRAVESKVADASRKLRHERAIEAPEAAIPSAGAALDRLILPDDVVARVSDLITPGSSLIVSDNRLSDETGEYTDFIVLTR